MCEFEGVVKKEFWQLGVSDVREPYKVHVSPVPTNMGMMNGHIRLGH